MTRARPESVTADPRAAGALLAQADAHLASSQTAGVDSESAYGLAYQAALKAMLAALTYRGLRVGAGTGGHVVIISEAAKLMPGHDDMFKRIDVMRRTRHTIFYDVEEVSGTELAGAIADANELLGVARALLAGGPA